ncbi:hypothetical protein L9G16_06685 [Shewanella sp. A25]|nr:hypothetical protein [Shewanella shenzhenensis]
MDNELIKSQFTLVDDRWIFIAGLEQYELSREVAKGCEFFAPDDEDEQIDDELRSCYNCQYRRWMMASFECLKLTNDSPQ